ncbi:MAG: putative addiction module component [Verrucomicrobiota bacterium]|jgi:hypothetical protein
MSSEEWHEQVMALPRELRQALAERLGLDWSRSEVAEDGTEPLPLDAAARELFAQVLLLPVAERRALATVLSSDCLAEESWEQQCIAIVEARLDRYDQGLEQAIPWEEVLAEMRQR